MADDKKTPEFKALENMARDLDSKVDASVAGPKPAGAVEVIDPAEAWAEIPAMVGGVLTMALPELKAAYSKENCRQWGEAMHRLALKRQWAADGVPPEVGVLLASSAFVVPTVLVIKMRKDKQRAERAAKLAAQQQAGAGQHALQELADAQAKP